MGWPMGNIINAEEEITKSAEYPNIKLFKVKQVGSQDLQEDLIEYDWDYWASTSDADSVGSFSSVCLLTATYMADNLGKNRVILALFDLSICLNQ